jgi:hypothetical protein
VADNTVLNSGSGGDTIASDDIGGVKHQRVKVEFGADGSATDVAAAAPLPIEAQVQSPQHERLTSANLAAGSNVDLTTADITTATTGKLAGIDITASIPMRCDVQTVSGARTTHTTVFTQAGETREYRTPHADYVTQAGGAGNGFGVSITNLDTSEPADVFATVFWQEA